MGFVLLTDREKMAVEWYVLHSKPGTPAGKTCLHPQVAQHCPGGNGGPYVGGVRGICCRVVAGREAG